MTVMDAVFIPDALKRTLTFKRTTVTGADARGNETVSATILVTVDGSIQRSVGRSVEGIATAEDSAGVRYLVHVKTRVSSVREFDEVHDADGTVYTIREIADWGGSIPQQFYATKASNQA